MHGTNSIKQRKPVLRYVVRGLGKGQGWQIPWQVRDEYTMQAKLRWEGNFIGGRDRS